MEEIVRAFNYVIEKGWVSTFRVQSRKRLISTLGFLLGNVRMVRPRYRGSIPYVNFTLRGPWLDRFHADVADKLNLIAPIAEQCQHQYV